MTILGPKGETKTQLCSRWRHLTQPCLHAKMPCLLGIGPRLLSGSQLTGGFCCAWICQQNKQLSRLQWQTNIKLARGRLSAPTHTAPNTVTSSLEQLKPTKCNHKTQLVTSSCHCQVEAELLLLNWTSSMPLNCCRCFSKVFLVMSTPGSWTSSHHIFCWPLHFTFDTL